MQNSKATSLRETPAERESQVKGIGDVQNIYWITKFLEMTATFALYYNSDI